MKSSHLALLSLAFTSTLLAKAERCDPEPAAPCNEDTCCRTYCLGPANVGVNAPVYPLTCNGDFIVSVSGFYWRASQEGMEYGVENQLSTTDTEQLSTLIDAKLLKPSFNWNFGFKVGLGYATACDGWDVSAVWTRYRAKASSESDTSSSDSAILLPIWSDFDSGDSGNPLVAEKIDSHWRATLNLADMEVGRKFWNSRRLAIRPHVGIRFASLDQNYDLFIRGGSWSGPPISQVEANGEVEMSNDFHGVGLRAGIDTDWNFGCGFALYGNAALSLIKGKFHVDQEERIREASAPFTKTPILEIENNFRESVLITDLALGLQYSALFCDCKYGLTAQFGYEQHLFFDQNQLWRITNKQHSAAPANDNLYSEGQGGDFMTQGWTLSFTLNF